VNVVDSMSLLLGVDLALIDPLVRGPDVLDGQVPVTRHLAVINHYPWIRNEREQTDRHRIHLTLAPPYYLRTYVQGLQ